MAKPAAGNSSSLAPALAKIAKIGGIAPNQSPCLSPYAAQNCGFRRPDMLARKVHPSEA
jgi:hypothetical protein